MKPGSQHHNRIRRTNVRVLYAQCITSGTVRKLAKVAPDDVTNIDMAGEIFGGIAVEVLLHLGVLSKIGLGAGKASLFGKKCAIRNDFGPGVAIILD